MDKATPTPSPSVESVMALVDKLVNAEVDCAASGYSLRVRPPDREKAALRAEVERLAAQSVPTDNSNGETRLWLWKNFVDGHPEYWAFDNPYPINLDNGDPQTLGEPCGYAIFKPSRSARPDFSEDEVLLRIAQAESKASYNLEPNNAEADAFDFLRFAKKNLDMHAARVPFAYNGLVTAAVAWIQSAEKILAAQTPAQAPAQPQAVVPAPPQEFESAQGRALASAWAEGWAQCRDAEYVGEAAQDEAFNQSVTLAQCLHADQTRFQGGLSNDQLRRAWSAKVPNVIPTDEQLTAFALGIEAAAQPSAQAERAPVVQAVQATEKGSWWCAHCGVFVMPVEVTFTERHDPEAGGCGFSVSASSGATPADVRMLTREELNDVAMSEQVGWRPGEYIEAIQRKFCAVNAGKRIPADGVIGGV